MSARAPPRATPASRPAARTARRARSRPSWCTRSAPGWEALCGSLDTPWERIGTLCVAASPDQQAGLEHLREQAHANWLRGRDRLRRSRPGARAAAHRPTLHAALHLPDDGIVDSLRLTIGYAELAAQNGVDFRFNSAVERIRLRGRSDHPRDARPRLRLQARFVVNAAGVEADTVSALAGGDEFRCWPRQGQYWLLDRELGGRFAKVVGGVPLRAHAGHLLRPHHQPLAASGADRRRPRATGPTRSVDRGHPRARVRRRPTRWCRRSTASYAIKTFAANRPASDTTYRVELDAQPREPDPRRRHPLHRRRRLAGHRRARARPAGRRRSARASTSGPER